MQNNDIKLIQNLLIQQNKYDLSIKLDGAYCKHEFIQEWNQDVYYTKIKNYLINVDLMTKNRKVEHYEK